MGERTRSVFIKKLATGAGIAALAVAPVVGWRMQTAQAAGAPSFVQQASATPSSGSSVKVTLSSAQTAGDTTIVAIGFENKTSTISSVTDSKGNTYQVAVPLTRDAVQSQALYYAKNIGAGSNTLTVTFNNSVSYPDIRVAEYANLDASAPFVAGTTATGTATAVNSGSVTASGAGLVFGAGTTNGAFSAAGSGLTKRVITADDNLVEDKTITAGGSYNATATAVKNSAWVMQVAVFRAAATTPADTTAPSVPTGLAATPASISQINLSWSAATDNVGVAGYRLYRGGVKVADTTGLSYADTGLSVNTAYSYTVSAYDAAGNESAQSTVVNATTPAPDTTAPSVPVNVTAVPATTSQINLQWSVSSDDTAVAGYTVYRNGVQVGTTTFPAFSDTLLSANTSYTYTISAYDASGNQSAQSDPVSAQTLAPDTTAPSVPTGLTATPVSSSEIDLSWAVSTDDRAMGGYTIYQNGAAVATTTSVSYKATGLSAATTYSFAVAATDAAGNTSAQSNPVSAATQASLVSSCALPAYPTPACTGVSPSATLTQYSGDYAVSTPNAVIDSMHITGDVNIIASGVVIKNSQIDGTVSDDLTPGASFSISDSTVGTATCSSTGTPSLWGHDITAARVYLHGHQDGVDMGASNVTVRDSYLQPCFLPLGTDGFHTDGLQDLCSSTCTNLILDHNTIDARGYYNGAAQGNSALNLGSVPDGSHLQIVTLTNNMFMGGGYSTDLRYTAGANWIVSGNAWASGTWQYDSVSTEGTCKNQTWSSNSVVTADANYAVTDKVSDLSCKD